MLLQFVMALIWLGAACTMLIWMEAVPDRPPPMGYIVGAFMLAAYNLVRLGTTWLKVKRARRDELDRNPPPAPRVVNPDFDFSIQPKKD